MEVSKMVPQFFYDVIARGIPGGALLVGISFALGDTTNIKQIVVAGVESTLEPITSTIVFLVMFAFYAYVLGHVIGPIGDWIAKCKKVNIQYYDHLHVLRNCVDPDKSKLPKKVQQYLEKELALNEDEKTSGNVEYTSVLFIWSDWLRLKSTDAGSRIVKLRAEYRMLIGLSVVGIFTPLLHLVCWMFIEEVAFNFILIFVGVIVFYSGLLGYCKAYSTFQWSVINNYYAQKIIDEETPDTQQKA